MKSVKIMSLGLGIGLILADQMCLAAPSKKSSAPSGGSHGRDWMITLPVVAETSQLRLHGEYNIDRSLGLALEAASLSAVEELSREEIEQTGNSLTINGLQASLLMTRYSDEANMGGFFWSLGAGYRRWGAEWKKQPLENELETKSQRLGLVDEKGYLHHRIQGEGVTGHGRIGYRYVASEWPLTIGLHLGIRHMNSRVKDVEVSEEEEKKLELQYSPSTNEERRSLKHQMMTTPDYAIDFGFVF